jgi:hypothetical protein
VLFTSVARLPIAEIVFFCFGFDFDFYNFFTSKFWVIS